MPRTVSLNMRAAVNAQQTDEVFVVLVKIDHEDLEDGPLYLSSDPTVRLSSDPLEYGTRSRGRVYKFALMNVGLPDDGEEAPPVASLVLENVASDMAKPLRSILTPASITLEVVLASAPDVVETRYRDFRAMLGRYDSGQIAIEIGLESIVGERWPAHSMSQARFPGLYR